MNSMKTIKYIILTIAGASLLNSCSDDDFNAGNPTMSPKTEISTAMFGDSLTFTVNATDADVPLSTLKAQLFYGDDMVSETVIRTKTNADYTGKIFVPYYANVPNATATLKLVLQNINFTITEKEYDLPLTRPDFEYLTLVTEELDEEGNNIEYRMERTDLYQYAVTAKFPQKVRAYIKSSKAGPNGNEMIFGWESNAVKEGTTTSIPFSNSSAGTYTIAFNSFSYEANPFVKLLVNGKEMEMVDENNYKIDLALSANQQIEITGIPDMNDWWIDPDFLTREADGKLKFIPLSGDYRITANFTYEYFMVEPLKDGAYATLQTDGTGAIWIIGDGVGKPSTNNGVGWNEKKAIPMASAEKGKYYITFVAGKSVSKDDINFKFFHQKDWGGEFTNLTLTTTSDIIFVGDGQQHGSIKRDPGNLGFIDGKTFDEAGIYKFTMDVTAGIDKAVLTVEKEGTEVPPAFEAIFDGTSMEAVSANTYKVEKEFTQGQEIEVSGISRFSTWWIDPDYFTLEDNGKLKFLPLTGKYRVTANTELKYFQVEAMLGNDLATLQPDGSGAIWVIGDDIGKPSLANQIGWNAGKGICMAPIGNKKYQLTVETGVNVNTNSINFKFFYQKGWESEFTSETLSTTSDIIFVGLGDDINGRGDGNLGISPGKTLSKDKQYVFTLDLSAGNDKAILTLTEK